MAEANLDLTDAGAALEAAKGDLRVALVMKQTGCSRGDAEQSLAASHGVVSLAIQTLSQP
jgi:NACalpha-BTF3-like transcription factor